MPWKAALSSSLWAAACSFPLGFSAAKTCRSRASGTISSPAPSRPRRSTARLRRSSIPFSLEGMVRLGLPDGDGAGLSSLEGPKEPQKTLFWLAPVCCICRLPHLCHRLFDANELFCPSPREVPQNKVHRLREVLSGLPDGCGRYGQHPEAGKILCPACTRTCLHHVL